MSSQSNPERTVKCPVDGCGAEKLARGIHLHVRQSKGGGHGPQGEVPEGISFEDLETVGTREVSMEYPDTRETEQVGRLCPYCERPFRGKHGVMIHLGHLEGRKNHPEDARQKHNPDDFAIVLVDEDENVIEVVEEETSLPATERRLGEKDDEPTSVEELREIVDSLRDRGLEEEANRIEKMLLND